MGGIAMIIVPLPTWLIDVLIASNLALSITILAIALTATHSLAIASFPTIVLLTTLFRVALNVSTTRLVLANADAGEVVRAFGNVVVQGNYIVGVVIFLVLSLVQLIVITKGAERVAEVTARFSLDGLAGKQMAIDADVRQGILDAEQAADQRSHLAFESRFFGAMDGAMKFVRGDVVASLAITAITVAGGMAIGLGQRALPTSVVLRKYTLLAIGDGLASQIAALVMSTAAAIVVTRVEREPQSLAGRDANSDAFGRRLASSSSGLVRVAATHGHALYLSSCAFVVFGALPGLPALPFWSVAAVMTTAASLGRRFQANAAAAISGQAHPALFARHAGSVRYSPSLASGEGGGDAPIAAVVPLSIDASAALCDRLELCDPREYRNFSDAAFLPTWVFPSTWRWRRPVPRDARSGTPRWLVEPLPAAFTAMLGRAQDRVFDARGIALPTPAIRRMPDVTSDSDPERLTFSINLREIPVDHFQIDAQCTDLDILSRLEAAISDVALAHASSFLGLEEVGRLVERVARISPSATRSVIPQRIAFTLLRDILKLLVDENVSIRDMPAIVDALASTTLAPAPNTPPSKPSGELDAGALADRVRVHLQRAITHELTQGAPELEVITLDSLIEDTLRRATTRSAQGTTLALAPTAARDVVSAIRRAFEQGRSGHSATAIALLAPPDLRRSVRKLIEREIPDLPVVTAAELTPTLRLVPLSRANLVGIGSDSD